jgi:hypothetical protein
MDPKRSPAPRPAADEVASLMGQLQALEHAITGTEQALLEAMDDRSASVLADLSEQHDVLGEAARDLESQIRRRVENSSALAIFATQDGSVRALAGSDVKEPGTQAGLVPSGK